MSIEPFGYFKPDPFGWTDCAETDDDAIPLYDKVAIKMIEKQRDELLAALKKADYALQHYQSGGANYSIEANRALKFVSAAISNAKG